MKNFFILSLFIIIFILLINIKNYDSSIDLYHSNLIDLEQSFRQDVETRVKKEKEYTKDEIINEFINNMKCTNMFSDEKINVIISFFDNMAFSIDISDIESDNIRVNCYY